MIEKFKAWARTHINRLFLGVPASLMVLGILGVVLTALPEDTEAHAQEVAGVKVELEQDRTEAQETLETEHRQLLDDLGGVDAKRVQRDHGLARDFVLMLAASSSTSRAVADQQASLDARYEVLDGDSRVLTEFLPEWMASTQGRQLTLSEIEAEVSGVQGLDYSYTVLARLDPVGDQGQTQYLFLTLSTAQDGTITAVEAYRVSNESRDELVTAEQDADDEVTENEQESTSEPSAGGDAEG